ncbi:hypothetical protein [Cellulosimicrobium sp. TH-20]|uniref:hypothetical protein n=1 Tax=Cellulosimicrobium sp. TH-20 TaxID=1980001 RepID=UPI00119DDB68|nr:hypothetical protein [Cellulosimicrobium sp. TH-20]
MSDLRVAGQSCDSGQVEVTMSREVELEATLRYPGGRLASSRFELVDGGGTVAWSAGTGLAYNGWLRTAKVSYVDLVDGATYRLLASAADVGTGVGAPAVECAVTFRVAPIERPFLVPVTGRPAVYVQHEVRGGPGVEGAFSADGRREADVSSIDVSVDGEATWQRYDVTEAPVFPFVPQRAGDTVITVRWVDTTGLVGPTGRYVARVGGAGEGAETPRAVVARVPVDPDVTDALVPLELRLSDDIAQPTGSVEIRSGTRTIASAVMETRTVTVQIDRASIGAGDTTLGIDYRAFPGDTAWSTEFVMCVNECALRPGTVTISGEPATGNHVRAESSGFGPEPARVSYQWLVDGKAIPGATEQGYAPAPWEGGRQLSVEVTASRPGFADATVRSASHRVRIVKDPVILASAHVSKSGWTAEIGWDGSRLHTVGTTGESRSIEALGFWIGAPEEGTTDISASSMKISAHVSNLGWLPEVPGGRHVAGTTGRGLPLQALRFALDGPLADRYDVYYRTHVQELGWLGWAKNGEVAGTTGYGLATEAIQITLVWKGRPAPAGTGRPAAYDKVRDTALLRYQAHVQDIGWQRYVSSGGRAGTTGQARRVEALRFDLPGAPSGRIMATAHVQDLGWRPPAAPGTVVGTSGRALRVEAFRLSLDGTLGRWYDVYYRTHAQNLGWLGWAKNGASSGTAGYAYRLEAVEVVLVPKGAPAPGAAARPSFVQKR